MHSSSIPSSDSYRAEPDWIDAIAHRAVQIGKWSPDQGPLWPRLANLVFFAALFDRLHLEPGQTKPAWHGALTPNEAFAVEHLADRLLVSGFVTRDSAGRPDLDIKAAQAVWRAAYGDLPEACHAPQTNIGDLRGRWFARIAAATAESLAARGAVGKEACSNRYRKYIGEDGFLCSRLRHWTPPHGPEPSLLSAGEEFIHYVFGVGSTTSALYSRLYRTEPRLRNGPKAHWNFGTWLHVGWDYGQRLEEHSGRALLEEMVGQDPEENLAFTHHLVSKLTKAAPAGDVTQETLGSACVAYIKSRHGLVHDGHGAEVCAHALDYGFFMAAGIRGLLPARWPGVRSAESETQASSPTPIEPSANASN